MKIVCYETLYQLDSKKSSSCSRGSIHGMFPSKRSQNKSNGLDNDSRRDETHDLGVDVPSCAGFIGEQICMFIVGFRLLDAGCNSQRQLHNPKNRQAHWSIWRKNGFLQRRCQLQLLVDAIEKKILKK